MLDQISATLRKIGDETSFAVSALATVLQR
jgi:hypothetical protein